VHRCAVLVALVFALGSCDAPNQAAPPSILRPNATADEVLAFLDRFDPRDFTSHPFVCVATGWPGPWGETPVGNTYHHGFLLADDGRRFVVQDLDGTRREFHHSPPNTPEWRRVGHSLANLGQHAISVAETLQDSLGTSQSHRVEPTQPISNLTYGWFTARACDRLGLHDAKARLVAVLTQLPWHAALPGDLDRSAALAREDRTLGWLDHMARLEALYAAWPSLDWAKSWAQARDAMRDWADVGNEPLDDRDVTLASDADLIEGLAEVCMPWELNGSGYPFTWDMTFEAATEPPHPVVAELLRRGPAIVPLLVDHCDDPRPARSWNWISRLSGAIFGATLGDNARHVLAMIVGDAAYARDFDAAHWCANEGSSEPQARLLARLDDPRGPWTEVIQWLLERPEAFGDALAQAWPDGEAAHYHVVLRLHAIANRHSRHAVDLVLDRLLAELATQQESRRTVASHCLLALGDQRVAAVLVGAWDHGIVDEKTPWEDVLRTGGEAIWAGIERHLAEPAFARHLLPALSRVPPGFVLENAHGLLRHRITKLLREHLVERLADESIACANWPVPASGKEVRMHCATFADLAATLLAAWFPRDFAFDPAVCGSRRHAQICQLRGSRAPELATPARSATLAMSLHVGTIICRGDPDSWPADLRDACRQLVDHAIDPHRVVAVLRGACTADPDHAYLMTFERDAGATSFVGQLGRRDARGFFADKAGFCTDEWYSWSGTGRGHDSNPFRLESTTPPFWVDLARPLGDSVEFTVAVEHIRPRVPAPR
jgi:hypothetical protein